MLLYLSKSSQHVKVIRWTQQGACGITSKYRLNNANFELYAFPSAAKATWFMGCACSTNKFLLPKIAAVIPQNSFTDRKAFLKVWHICLNRSLAVVWLILHILWVVLHLSTLVSHLLHCWLSWEGFVINTESYLELSTLFSPLFSMGFTVLGKECCFNWSVTKWPEAWSVTPFDQEPCVLQKCDLLFIIYNSLGICVAHTLHE